MSRSLRRGALAAIVLAAIVPLSACAAGNTPDTLQVKPDNAATSIGNTLKLNNIVVVTKADAVAEQPGPANVTVNISNQGSTPETLKSIALGGGASATFTDAKGATVPEIVIPAGGSVLLGGPDQPEAHLATAAVKVGGFTDATFTFGTAGKVTSAAQVYSAKGPWEAFGPAAAPTGLPTLAGASASASASASAGATAGASATPGATPSGSASATAGATGTPGATPSGSASPSAH
ncbi:hypothetical protein CFP65_3260 [Kitasatospora sp. MMS16-BH015]|uniref:DUF461 domain-containing protein n=1 Tax=Kitasatospora sp. MMS16-BH015 TaxID=2018025 RepID=UPI000CA3BBC3|nr:DUF461 domain-containing protein [Kitasatospora sp. MMS16-BH015]AUG78062.1 hypothetical protein CFP65_3260 [Kitasatospora sp. MMS16-BH015]